MVSIPFHFGSWVMKSMETLSHDSLGIRKGPYNPNFFLQMDFVLWHLTQMHMKCYTSSFISAQ
jgi:hypothetical protein